MLNILTLLLPNYAIGSDSRSIEEKLSFEFSYTFTPVLITGTGQSLPVIFSREDGKIDQAKWGLRSFRNKNHLFPWIRSEGIIRGLHSRVLIRKQRCLVPANGFFIRRGEKIYFVYFPKEKVVTFGGVWQLNTSADQNTSWISFALISCPATGMISQFTPRMPFIVHGGNLRKYLNKEIPLMDISRILKKELKLEFNGFPLDPGIFHRKDLSRKDFRPSGERLLQSVKFPEKAILGSYYYG